jgi:hypothetical protein
MADLHEGAVRVNGGNYVTLVGAFRYSNPTDLAQNTGNPGVDGCAVALQVDTFGNMRVIPAVQGIIASTDTVLKHDGNGLMVSDASTRAVLEEMLQEVKELRLQMAIAYNLDYRAIAVPTPQAA